MSTSRYHHGDLRNVLLAAAERMLDADVSRQFSLRELAREAGVSHAAPYKHFTDRAQLVECLALRWMTDFVDAQEAVVTGDDPAADLLAAGSAYVQWAAAHPARFSIIFDPALNRGAGAQGLPAQASRHERLLVSLVAEAVRAGDLPGPPDVAARHLWASAHGLATLVILGHLDPAAAGQTLQHAMR